MKKFDEWYKNYPPTTHYLPRYEYGELVWSGALNWIYHKVKADGDPDNMFRIIFEEWNSE